MDIRDYLDEELGEYTEESGALAEGLYRRMSGRKTFYSAPDEGAFALPTEELRRFYDSVTEEEWNAANSRKPLKDESERFLGLILEAIENEDPDIITEGGCCQGIEACFLAMRFPGKMFEAYDISGSGIRIAAKRAEKYGLRNIRFGAGSHDDYKFGSGTGMLYMHNSFNEEEELVPDPASWNSLRTRRLRRFCDALAPGGSLIITQCGPAHESGRTGSASSFWEGR